MRTRARRVEDGWQLDGHKLWTSHAAVAAGIVVAARKDARGDEPGQISLFMVEPDAEGCEVLSIDTIGMEATTLCDVRLTGVRVPADAELTPGAGGLQAGPRPVQQARVKGIFLAVGAGPAPRPASRGAPPERPPLWPAPRA